MQIEKWYYIYLTTHPFNCFSPSQASPFMLFTFIVDLLSATDQSFENLMEGMESLLGKMNKHTWDLLESLSAPCLTFSSFPSLTVWSAIPHGSAAEWDRRLGTQEGPMLQLWCEGCLSAGRIFSCSGEVRLCSLQLIGWGPPTLLRAVCFTLSPPI